MALDKVKDDMLQDNLVFPGSTTQFPSITTTQRDALSGVQPGTIIYNSTVGKLQQYDGNNSWETIASPPVITSITYPTENGITATALEASGTTNVSETLIINGSNFSTTSDITVQIQVSGSYVAFASSISVNSGRTQITCTGVTKRAAADDYVIKVTNATGLSATTTVNFSADPSFSTAANLGQVFTGDTLSIPIAFTGVDVKQGATAKPTWMTVTGNAPSGSDANGAGATAFLATGSPATLGGTAANTDVTNNYTFSIIVRDAENQTFNRDYSLTVTDPHTGGIVGTFTGDGTVGTNGQNYRFHIFKVQGTTTSTSQGYEDITFTTTIPLTLEYIAVAGGGGGASVNGSGGGGGGGGGAGGVLSNIQSHGGPAITNLAAGAHTIRLGLGGAAQTSSSTGGITGGDTKIISAGGSTLVHCRGGGGGGDPYGGSGLNGGSGGGAAESNGSAVGGKGVYPGSSFVDAVRQGYDGGATTAGGSTAAGGGGWGAAGANYTGGQTGSNGGAGNFTTIIPLANRNGIGVESSSKIYLAGGGGGASDSSGSASSGGVGGGGGGGNSASHVGDGAAHSGSGGGAGGRMAVSGSSGSGGSGIVVIRYAI